MIFFAQRAIFRIIFGRKMAGHRIHLHKFCAVPFGQLIAFFKLVQQVHTVQGIRPFFLKPFQNGHNVLLVPEIIFHNDGVRTGVEQQIRLPFGALQNLFMRFALQVQHCHNRLFHVKYIFKLHLTAPLYSLSTKIPSGGAARAEQGCCFSVHAAPQSSYPAANGWRGVYPALIAHWHM